MGLERLVRWQSPPPLFRLPSLPLRIQLDRIDHGCSVAPEPVLPAAAQSVSIREVPQAEGNALDQVSTNHGTGGAFVPGKVGQAFQNPQIIVPDAPGLKPRQFSIEGWFYANALWKARRFLKLLAE